MAMFGGLVMTNNGRNLYAKAQTGKLLKIKKIVLGDGELGSSESMIGMTQLKNKILDCNILDIKIMQDEIAKVTFILTNKELLEGFTWRELGVIAEEPDTKEEVLYCYANARENGEYISPKGGADILEKHVSIDLVISNVENVSAVIDESLVFVTKKEVDETIKQAQQELIADLGKDYIGTNIKELTVAGYGRMKKLYGKMEEIPYKENGFAINKSPDYPSTLKCVGDDVNLFNKDGDKTGIYINASGVEEGSDVKLVYLKQIITPTNSKYTMSYKTCIGASNVRFSYFNGDTFISREVSNQNGYVFNVPSNCTKIDVRVDDIIEGSSSRYFEELKIQEGLAATPYSPHGYSTVENISTDGTNTSSNVVYVDKPLCSIDKSLNITGENFEQGDLNPITGEEEESTLGIMRSDYIKARGNITIKRLQAIMELVIFEYDISKKFITNTNSFLGNEENIELNENTKYIRLVDAYTSGNRYDLYGEVFGIRDELDYTNKKITRRCGLIVLNGTESWLKHANTDNNIHTYYLTLKDLAFDTDTTVPKARTSHFIYSYSCWNTNKKSGQFSGHPNTNTLYFNSDKTTLEAFKAWLALNPVTIVYKLATSIEEQVECSGEIVQYDVSTSVYNRDGTEIEVELTNNQTISGKNEIISVLEKEINELKKQVTDLTAMVVSV